MSGFDSRYSNLNPKQRLAVDTIEGPVLVLAGPGAGKTELLSLRVANILKLTDVNANNILCLTFTDSAAFNMRQRLAGLIGKDAYKVAIHTFHSFSNELISSYPEYFRFSQVANAASDLIQVEILTKIFNDLEFNSPLNSKTFDGEYVYFKDSLKLISSLKQNGISPDLLLELAIENFDYFDSVNSCLSEFFDGRLSSKHLNILPDLLNKLQLCLKTNSQNTLWQPLPLSLINELSLYIDNDKTTGLSSWKQKNWSKNPLKSNGYELKDSYSYPKLQAFCDIYKKYQQALYSKGYYDFDDMLIEVAGILKSNHDLQALNQEKYQYILVDEFQDTNGVQLQLLNLLINMEISLGNPNILAVGDSDQAVYKFQGANLENILKFKNQFPNLTVIQLDVNYRSTQEILDFASQIIEQDMERLSSILGISKKLIAHKKS